jgi:enoyl-CoA hydratase/carnithine racemase
MSEQVLTELDNGVLKITINRPEKKNALNAAMYAAMTAAIAGADGDDAVRVILLTGTGDAFSSGNDIADFVAAPASQGSSPAMDFLRTLAASALPVVAAVNGLAVGVGTTLLLHCDQVYAASSARFILPFVNLGVVPEAGSSLLLPRQAGYQKAAELLMLGEPFDAETAREAGIVCRVCPAETLLQSATETALKLASKPRGSLRATKQLLRRENDSVEQRMAAEIEAFVVQIQSPASREIMAAFVERREPDATLID